MTNTKLMREIARWRKRSVRLLVLSGKRKSGKDVLVDYVMRRYRGIRHYRIAEAPNLIAKLLGLPQDRKIQQALFGVNKLLYPVLGESAYKRRVARLIDREKPQFAIVEAARTKEEYEEFVKKRGGILIGVVARNVLRYERALRDARHAVEKKDEGSMTFPEFMARERIFIERQIDWIVGRAHFVAENNYQTPAPFYRQIDNVMTQLGFKKKR